MRRLSAVVAALAALILTPVAIASAHPDETAFRVFQVATSMACAEKATQCQVIGVSREELGSDVVYYRAIIKVGPADYDVIALNRVVLEHRGGLGFRSAGSLFFIHGSGGRFRMLVVNPHGGNGLAVFLAKHNLDAWGIDLRNVQIPADAVQIPNAHDWDLGLQVKDVRLGTRIARWARALTGQGIERLILSGHSSGATVGYAVVNAEAAAPRAQRDIGGIIPIDMVYKLPSWATSQIQLSCNVAAGNKSLNDAGTYFSNNLLAIAVAKLAQTDPKGVSPYGPPLTNQQFLLKMTGALSFWPAYPFHRFALVLDDAGLPSDGRFTTAAEIANLQADVPPYPIPNAFISDMFAVSCPTVDTPYDDNLGEVNIPVLYIGQAGGFGALGEYTPDLLGSSDVTKMMIQFLSDADSVNDFGHMEVFTAEEAQQLVWEPMLKWIVHHQPHP
jgi:hypothetical protein